METNPGLMYCSGIFDRCSFFTVHNCLISTVFMLFISLFVTV